MPSEPILKLGGTRRLSACPTVTTKTPWKLFATKHARKTRSILRVFFFGHTEATGGLTKFALSEDRRVDVEVNSIPYLEKKTPIFHVFVLAVVVGGCL